MNTCKDITINAEIQSGRPVFTGTRVTIDILFQYVEAGDTIDAFIADFPGVSREQAVNVLEYSKVLAMSA